MARIALIPTGRMEWLALGPALNRLFPGHSFYSAPAADPLDSLTSCDVSRLALRRNNADKLVARSALEVLTNPRKGGADFAIIVEDLELYNLSQAAIVTSAVRSAVQRHLDRLSDLDLRARTREALRERVSYHLAKPMTESWFFADPLGIQRAGVSPERGAKLVPDASIEDFQSADQDYELATDEYCVRWRGLPSSNGHEEKRKNKLRPDWIKAGADRSRHPKAYLSWLMRDPDEPGCSSYQETHGGVAALRDLDWSAVLNHASGMPFLASLVGDLADALDQDPSSGVLESREAPETRRIPIRPNRFLRNL